MKPMPKGGGNCIHTLTANKPRFPIAKVRTYEEKMSTAAKSGCHITNWSETLQNSKRSQKLFWTTRYFFA